MALVSETKRLALIDALRQGQIASLTSLHQPNSDVHKDITFFDAAFGTTAIEEYLPLAYTYLIRTGIIGMEQFIALASSAPGSQVGIEAGKIEVGKKADLIVLDPSATTHVSHHHSLYKNEMLQGRVTMAICRGEVTRF